MADPSRPDPTPAEREQRIAELRRRRRARVRLLGVRAALAAGALMLVVVALGYWVLGTVGGRDFLLGQVVARLPADAELTWRQAEGPASGPLTLRGVHFTYNGIVFDAERVTLDPALRPLLGRHLRLDALQLEDARLDLPESADEPFELPRWPDVLPDIAPPLALSAADVQVDGLQVSRAGAPLVDVRRLRGGLHASSGRLQLEDLHADTDRGRFAVDGEYVPADDYRADLVATAVLPAAPGRTRPRLGLVARGDLSNMQLALAGQAPGPLRATLALSTRPLPGAAGGTGAGIGPTGVGAHRPHWRLQVATDAFDPALLTAPDATPSPTPLAVHMQVDGIGGDARLSGDIRQGSVAAQVLPSRIQLEAQVLRLDPLHVQVLEGEVVATGTADFSQPRQGAFNLSLAARGLQWGGTPAAAVEPVPVVSADANLGLAGTLQAWAVAGSARVQRDGEQATLELDGRGDDRQLSLHALHVAMPSGTLDGTGSLAWAPTLGWELSASLAGFDPGYFAPGWDGAVDAAITTTGTTRDDGGLEAEAAVTGLSGQLRGRALGGSARVAMHGAPAGGAGGNEFEGEAALRLGDSRIEASGRVGARIEVDARLQPLQLADLLPDASGTLRGSVQVRGAASAPDLAVELEGSNLRHGEYAAANVSVRGDLPWSRGSGQLVVAASDVTAGIALQRLDASARGAVEDLQLELAARADAAALELGGSLRRAGNRWQGTLASLALMPATGADWHLREPAAFHWASQSGGLAAALDEACLAATGGGVLCVGADWPRQGAWVSGQALPLALVAAYLPEREPGRPWVLDGEIGIDARLRPVSGGWDGQARVTSASGGVRTSERSRRQLVGYRDLLLEADFRRQGIEARLGTTLTEGGQIRARLATGWDAYAPLDGELSLDIRELGWLELFSPDIVEPAGTVAGTVRVGGTRDQPRLEGVAALRDFRADLPALAISVQQGQVRLAANPDGSATIRGSLQTASAAGNADGGVLEIDGSLGWQGEVPLVLNIRGEDVLVADSLDLRAVASPDLQVTYQAGQPLKLTGRVRVPEARIDLERLDSAVAVSPDVVVLDPVEPDDGPAAPLDMNLTVLLGDNVRMNGYGLEGGLGGGLNIRARPGREMTATGRVDVSGEYTAYGQDLRITRGQLNWSDDPVSDPAIALRAERVVGDVTAGVDVSGRASNPQAEVWSNPASSQPDALAYLTLGRPLSNVSSGERDQLNAASAALTAGSSLLASQVGARIGLDDAGVMDSRALGGSVFGVGKYLSPNLYISYGVSLLGTGQAITLKYLLGRGFDIEIESSTLENRGSVNWRTER